MVTAQVASLRRVHGDSLMLSVQSKALERWESQASRRAPGTGLQTARRPPIMEALPRHTDGFYPV